MQRSDSSDDDTESSEGTDVEERTSGSVEELGEQEKVLEAVQELRKIEKQIQVESTVLSAYSGPLPPPRDLAEYERIVPGSGKRWFEIAEKEQRLRATVLEGGVKNERRRIDGAG